MVEDTEVQEWFCAEVLPLEPALMGFLRRHWHSPEECTDIRQDIYERLLVAASRELPRHPSGYLFTVARSVLINRARRATVISIELVAEIEKVMSDADWLTPERHLDGREELRRVGEGLDRLPPRCREVVRLRKVEGMSTREVATRLGIGIDAVEQQTVLGMRALVDFMQGGEGRIKRPRRKGRRLRQRAHD